MTDCDCPTGTLSGSHHASWCRSRQQGNLFDSRRPVDEPKVIVANEAQDTSRIAAERIYPKTGTMRGRVAGILRATGPHGLTDEEIQARLKMSGNSERPARGQLVRDGWVKDSGRRRNQTNGNPAIVWIWTP
jgi:hypothetical protein